MFLHIKAFEQMMQTNCLASSIKFMIEGEEEIVSANLSSFLRKNVEKLKAGYSNKIFKTEFTVHADSTISFFYTSSINFRLSFACQFSYMATLNSLTNKSLSGLIKDYYSSTQFEYLLIWNWRIKDTPALHFGYYDEKAKNHSQAIIRANEALAEWAEIKPNTEIIDAGCGLGHSAIWLSKNYQAKVTGITLVPKQVKTIQKNLSKNPVPNVQFLVADYLKMPFENNSADVIWAFESVCHAESKLEFYKEAFRVLKPGGKLVMAEYLRTDRPLEKDKEKFLHEIFDQWFIPDLDTLQEHEKHAKNAGFSEFKNRDVTSNVFQSYKNLRQNCKRFKGLSSFLFQLGIISSVRHCNLLGSMKQADAIEEGIFTYHHLLAKK